MKFFPLYVLLFLVGCSGPVNPDISYKIAQATVMITNLDSNSGGTGTIVFSNSQGSKILTNSHVCRVVMHGGFVHTESGDRHMVAAFAQSKSHDLCLIQIKEDLKVISTFAPSSPRIYSPAIVSGHPHLMPTMITAGRFAKKMLVEIMTGVRPCTDQESLDPNTGLFCLALKGIPIITSYEATPVTALIQPGSSGSAVYNDKGEISAVIFAGSKDLSFGEAVPYEYVMSFILYELPSLEVQFPNNTSSIASNETSNKTLYAKLVEVCGKAKTSKQKELCGMFIDAARSSLISN